MLTAELNRNRLETLKIATLVLFGMSISSLLMCIIATLKFGDIGLMMWGCPVVFFGGSVIESLFMRGQQKLVTRENRFDYNMRQLIETMTDASFSGKDLDENTTRIVRDMSYQAVGYANPEYAEKIHKWQDEYLFTFNPNRKKLTLIELRAAIIEIKHIYPTMLDIEVSRT